jgi:hypothetical protein
MNKENLPPNNGKDVRKPEAHRIHGMGGFIDITKNDQHPMKVKGYKYNYEPKRNNRWTIKFKEPYQGIPQWCLKKTSRPKLINGSWQNIEIFLRDTIGPSTTQALIDGFRYNWQKNRIRIPIMEYSLEMLDPTGVTVEKWDVRGEVVEADFGDLSYEEDILSEIKLIIQPTKVILEY